MRRVTEPAALAELERAAKALGPAATDPAALARSLVADAAAPYQGLVEEQWRQNVLIPAP